MKNKLFFIGLIFIALATISCKNERKSSTTKHSERKIGVLLVNHGSHSENWRNALLSLEKNVSPELKKNPNIKGIKTAFMEYTEPSIATQLKAFDKDGFTDIIMVPVFLTVSPHSFDDIPTIVGMKEDPYSLNMLKIEKIERYTPKAKVHIMPLLDFSDILEKNILSRVKKLSKNPEQEAVTLVGYGDKDYEKQWEELFTKVGNFLKEQLNIQTTNYAWCGHIAHYKSEPTTKAINQALQNSKTAIVIPVLVAVDEYFQIKIIGDAVSKVDDYKNRVIYKPDAILPDENVEKWVISVVNQYIEKITDDHK